MVQQMDLHLVEQDRLDAAAERRRQLTAAERAAERLRAEERRLEGLKLEKARKCVSKRLCRVVQQVLLVWKAWGVERRGRNAILARHQSHVNMRTMGLYLEVWCEWLDNKKDDEAKILAAGGIFSKVSLQSRTMNRPVKSTLSCLDDTDSDGDSDSDSDSEGER
jgi:hypothetical protein